MSKITLAIEKVKPGVILAQDIVDPKINAVVYSRGIRLNTEMINNILSLDYLEILVVDPNNLANNESNKLPNKHYKAGEYIVFQGEIAKSIFILKSGILQVIATEEQPPLESLEKAKLYVNEYGKVVSNIKGANTKFGEMAAILNGVRKASIKSLTDSEIISISTDEKSFKNTLTHNYQLGLSITMTLVNRLINIKKSTNDIDIIYSELIKKKKQYKDVYNKVLTSLKNKLETHKGFDWLTKIVKEVEKIEPFASTSSIKKVDIKRKLFEASFSQGFLPDELEHYLNINTYLCKAGNIQKEFYILKKGKIEALFEGSRTHLYETPGDMILFLEPLKRYKNFCDTYKQSLKCISPTRYYKIEIEKLEEIYKLYPRIALFITKNLANYIVSENDYFIKLQDILETNIDILAIGDNNYRRAYKRFFRILEKFSKDRHLTKNEFELAKNMTSIIDKDYNLFKELLAKAKQYSLND